MCVCGLCVGMFPFRTTAAVGDMACLLHNETVGGIAGGRGGKRSHKGQKRHFTSEDEIRQQQAKEEKEKAWRVSRRHQPVKYAESE